MATDRGRKRSDQETTPEETHARKHTHGNTCTETHARAEQPSSKPRAQHCTQTEQDKTIRHRWDKHGGDRTIGPGREGTKGGSVEQWERNKSAIGHRKQQEWRINKNLKHRRSCFSTKAQCQEPLRRFSIYSQPKRSRISSISRISLLQNQFIFLKGIHPRQQVALCAFLSR